MSKHLARLACCDCTKWLLEGGDDRQKFDLIFADPPFNIGHNYVGFRDSRPWEDYVRFTGEWLVGVYQRLADHGALWINVPDEIVSHIDITCAKFGLHRMNWCIWHYRFGQWRPGNFIRAKVHVLWFVNDPSNYTFNADAVAVPSDRATTYNDKRTHTTKTPGLRPPFDVWGIPSDGPNWGRVQGNNAERWNKHPNQLPEVYLERVIRACSNPGDWVLDPFLGSGTAGVVAQALGRKFVGIDISHANIESARRRLERGAVRIKQEP